MCSGPRRYFTCRFWTCVELVRRLNTGTRRCPSVTTSACALHILCMLGCSGDVGRDDILNILFTNYFFRCTLKLFRCWDSRKRFKLCGSSRGAQHWIACEGAGLPVSTGLPVLITCWRYEIKYTTWETGRLGEASKLILPLREQNLKNDTVNPWIWREMSATRRRMS
jgi:hypothetical protein